MIKAKSKKKLQKAGGFMGNLAQITPYVEPRIGKICTTTTTIPTACNIPNCY